MSQCESVASTVSAQEDEDIEASNEEENPEDSEGTTTRPSGCGVCWPTHMTGTLVVWLSRNYFIQEMRTQCIYHSVTHVAPEMVQVLQLKGLEGDGSPA